MLLEGEFQPVLVSEVTSTGRRSDQYWLILLTRTTSISDQYWLLFRSLEGVLIACMYALLLRALQVEMPRGDTQTIALRCRRLMLKILSQPPLPLLIAIGKMMAS